MLDGSGSKFNLDQCLQIPINASIFLSNVVLIFILVWLLTRDQAPWCPLQTGLEAFYSERQYFWYYFFVTICENQFDLAGYHIKGALVAVLYVVFEICWTTLVALERLESFSELPLHCY